MREHDNALLPVIDAAIRNMKRASVVEGRTDVLEINSVFFEIGETLGLVPFESADVFHISLYIIMYIEATLLMVSVKFLRHGDGAFAPP